MMAVRRFSLVVLFLLVVVTSCLSLVQALSIMPSNQFTKQRQWNKASTLLREVPFLLGSTRTSGENSHQYEPFLDTTVTTTTRGRNKRVGSFAFLRTSTASPPDTKELSTTSNRKRKGPSLWKQRLGVVAGLFLAALVLTSQPAMASSKLASTTTSAVNLAPMLSRREELRLMGRMWYAAALGALIGKERSTANHHPAGVRTLALVSLGSSAFTLVSMYGFGPLGKFDTSRMASAVASGIGFIGAGVITTTTRQKESVVHGLTTAAAVWISAAVGVTCGSGLYILATSLGLASLAFLRLGGNVKHKRSYHRHPEKALAEMVESDPELIRRLIDWEKVYYTPDYKLPEPAAPKKIVKIKPILTEDKNDECLISKRYFPQAEDQKEERSSRQHEHDDQDMGEPVDDDDYFHDDDDDELVIMSSQRGYANETEYGGEQGVSRRSRSRYDDDVGP